MRIESKKQKREYTWWKIQRYLLDRDVDLTAKCNELQNRIRRNMRIFQIAEGNEGKDPPGFVKKLLNDILKLPSGIDIKIERAHRSLTSKPEDLTAPPRSIIIRFLDEALKYAEAILTSLRPQAKFC